MNKKLIIIFVISFSILLAEGNDNTMLKVCPNSPNCVSSHSRDTRQYIEPITIDNSLIDIKERLVKAIEKVGGKISENNGDFLKVSFKSKIFGFEDIAFFEIKREKKIIDVRSAAETGWYDFGMNRKRIEKIRNSL
ncbi:DUF1499 domain-containing protein [Cetobacterium sp.]|uniref:DUF1499 domain-containing protein n=1 Tax=Cetobacterium sp. TaxID=2071632 RepID=UPI003F2C2776